jgi:predicted HTH domain antitoxin
MKNTFTVEYPAALPDAMNLSRQEFEKEAKFAMAAKLFELGRLSSGMAAQLVGIGRVEFLLRLNDYGVSMIDLTDDELENDVENA